MARLGQGKASKTARWTAAIRHRHHVGGIRPLVYDDAFARHFLDAGSLLIAAPMPVADWALGRMLGPVRAIEGEVLARSRYVDDMLATQGFAQVIVLGAGFDTMALSRRGTAAHFFEVDHPATQAAKRTAMARAKLDADNIVFVPVDFAKNDLAGCLLHAGLDPATPSLTSWLGVTMYLRHETMMATLETLRLAVASGSRCLFDAYPQTDDITLLERPLFAAMRAFTASRGEPMLGLFDSARFAKELPALGWRITERIDGTEMRQRWFANQPRAIHPPESVLLYAIEAV
jgi:methyltransferase (TIGR00027 family)